ncbi:ABC-type transport auxiliary lipoprotein family protein [Sphingosinicella sp. CPCC 101087]|uniref:ABC-type transport auxiliary lipoprotein family protein n=1 Tax=Sphingosinicella sp. CPCC 101087 TaxID=2497754 RepID=UPI00101D43F6|nr:ABC-type transport auxiliary lipoprotein family protein [Sphingosinicella sp. CPCC 101087]
MRAAGFRAIGRPGPGRTIAAGLAVLLLGACLGGPDVPDQLLTLSASSSRAAAAQTSAPGQTISIAEPSVPQALRTPRVPVYVSETAIQYLQDAQWIEYPGALFGRLMSEVISARTGRVVLHPDQFVQDPGLRVTGQLHRFGIDSTTMEAVMVYDAAVLRGDSGITTNRFEARVPVAGVTPEAVAPALNQAANQVAEQVAAWVAQ